VLSISRSFPARGFLPAATFAGGRPQKLAGAALLFTLLRVENPRSVKPFAPAALAPYKRAHMTANQMFTEMSPALAVRIVEEVHATDKDLYRVALANVAMAKKVRPIFLEQRTKAERFRMMAEALRRTDLQVVAGNVISGWLVKNQQPLLIDFLTALHIPHQNGVVDTLPATVDDKDLHDAVELLLGKSTPEVVGLYLRAFYDMNEADWPNLKKIIAEDVRLMLGA
jgi:hypothetical protein